MWGKATTTMRRALIALSVAAAVASAAPLSAVYGKNDYKAAVEAAKAVLVRENCSTASMLTCVRPRLSRGFLLKAPYSAIPFEIRSFYMISRVS